jgi:hypothetical protein
MDRITKNIHDDVNELSNLNLQRKLWLNENNNTGLISSYVEVMCRLFDDNGMDNFIDEDSTTYNLDTSIIKELKTLRTLILDYDETHKTDCEIINDPEWQKISKQSQIVISYWKPEE